MSTGATPLHYADVWEAVADAIGEVPAVIQGDRTVTWAEFDDRSSRLAAAFAAAGLGPDSKVGMFLYNSPEYLETQFAAFKQRIVPINVNYRYLEDELVYLLDNADCEALVFHSSLGDRVEAIRGRLPDVRLYIEVADDTRRCDAVHRYDDVLAANAPATRIERAPDDIYMLYTGGTTGMPKGVMYHMGPAGQNFLDTIALAAGHPPFTEAAQVGAFARLLADADATRRVVPCCPLMHGTGCWLGGFITHLAGGTIVLLEGRGLDTDEVWRTVERERVTALVVVGDAFARPMLRALDDRAATGTPYDTSSLQQMISSGAMFSQEVKEGLIGHIPQLAIVDILGSTEGGMGRTVATAGAPAPTAKFGLNPGTTVFDEHDRPVEPGSGVVGRVGALSPAGPIGYFKDPEKSARTFREIDGRRYTFAGDMATIEADGSITLLGRGSHCINTGGEKVFPEEVEEAVKAHVDVDDCLVFGVSDERFGERVAGVASLRPGGSATSDDLIAHTKEHLSHYKAPRQLVIVDTVPRAPNGKADYVTARSMAGLD